MSAEDRLRLGVRTRASAREITGWARNSLRPARAAAMFRHPPEQSRQEPAPPAREACADTAHRAEDKHVDMRKIDTRNFSRATRTTPKEINRQIVLNLVREHQPISRADLARLMGVARGMVTPLVNELLDEGLIYEGATGNPPRGRKPTLLHVRSHDRLAVSV